jgi:hypothetical protein
LPQHFQADSGIIDVAGHPAGVQHHLDAVVLFLEQEPHGLVYLLNGINPMHTGKATRRVSLK